MADTPSGLPIFLQSKEEGSAREQRRPRRLTDPVEVGDAVEREAKHHLSRPRGPAKGGFGQLYT